VATYPWQYRFHEPIIVTLALKGDMAKLAGRIFPAAQVVEQGAESRVTVTATFLDGLVRYALSLAPNCRVLDPARAVERWREMASRLLECHRDSRRDGAQA
jgi:proteasome accessory factor B